MALRDDYWCCGLFFDITLLPFPSLALIISPIEVVSLYNNENSYFLHAHNAHADDHRFISTMRHVQSGGGNGEQERPKYWWRLEQCNSLFDDRALCFASCFLPQKNMDFSQRTSWTLELNGYII